jgi:hypothetical protein
MENDKLQQQKQNSGFLGESQEGETLGGLTMMPPQFKLAASAADGGGGEDQQELQHSGFEGTFLESEAATWPGEMVMVHSPCYSQEIEAIALETDGHPGKYLAAAAAIDAKLEECKHRKFQNADGLENDWAHRQLGDTVKMNAENLAATSNQKKGWPKLVVLTFWKDPSNPGKGGFNYTHILYFPFVEFLPKKYSDEMPGGCILMGDGGGGIDLGHHAKNADINEWLPIVTKALNQIAGLRSDPKSFRDDLQFWRERLQKLAEDAEKINSKVNEIGKSINDDEAEKEMGEKWEGEKYVEIDGVQYERMKKYSFTFKVNGQQTTGHMTPAGFLKEYGAVKYEIISITSISE